MAVGLYVGRLLDKEFGGQMCDTAQDLPACCCRQLLLSALQRHIAAGVRCRQLAVKTWRHSLHRLILCPSCRSILACRRA